MRKPAWVIDKERARRVAERETLWLFGLHAVGDALANPNRRKHRLVVTRNAADRLAGPIAAAGVTPEIVDARKFPGLIDPGSVHQGAVLEASPLDWGTLEETCAPPADRPPPVVVLDRVSDPHNAGAILRSAEVFGARAVIAPARHAAPETGALAKSASGALERQPYLRVRNLAAALETLGTLGYWRVGLDGAAATDLESGLAQAGPAPVAVVLGAEGPGLRPRTRSLCDTLARIPATGAFGSLNVSNAAAVALYAARPKD